MYATLREEKHDNIQGSKLVITYILGVFKCNNYSREKTIRGSCQIMYPLTNLQNLHDLTLGQPLFQRSQRCLS